MVYIMRGIEGMGKKGFTLIEITSALLIFAIGGTIAMSVFTVAQSNRAGLEQSTEATIIANNLLQTLVLKTQTDPAFSNTINNPANHNTWNPPQPGTPAYFTIGAQQWNSNGSLSTSRGITVYNCSCNYGVGLYEWRFIINQSDVDINPRLDIERIRVNGTFLNPLDPLGKLGLTFSNFSIKILTVEVSWPNTLIPAERRNVVLSSVVI
ncbi:MAG: type II secretion system protein [Candidatus Aureabacteria bacterium]|nr:type II secretion system protein [Candidatus Auribacterota bacterium]